MLEPYILIGGPDLLVLQYRVNLYAQDQKYQDYQPVGTPFRGQDQWFQAMYRAPDPDDRRDLSGEEPDDERARGYKLGSYADLRVKNAALEKTVAELRAQLEGHRTALDVMRAERDEISKLQQETPVPEFGPHGVIGRGDLNPVPLDGDEPIPMTWEQECERLKKENAELRKRHEYLSDRLSVEKEKRHQAEEFAAHVAKVEYERDGLMDRLEQTETELDTAIKRAEAAEKERDEARAKLEAAEKQIANLVDERLDRASEWPQASVSDPEYLVTVHRPDAPRWEFVADRWEADPYSGGLTIWRDDQDEPVAEFPPGEWRVVEAQPVEPCPDQCDIGRKGP